ncbi:hypothetical protein [Streptomyces sp. NBC_00872]|uniref:hypothetical protein n=1 Tax=Streptomyces sp. NBC_00872 TaxID=2903686 RepID=UPI003865B82A|nr:hypothetical protein OG214_22100 [Streptomyces sp. NBC_00872]
MLRTTDHTTETTPVLPAAPAGSDPLRQLQYETRPPSGPGATRGLNHPQELSLRGIPVRCSACRARRDWLLINQRCHVWVRCRCTNQWLEPEITRADFDAMIAIPNRTHYPSLEQGLIAMGFDGAFAGTYLE